MKINSSQFNHFPSVSRFWERRKGGGGRYARVVCRISVHEWIGNDVNHSARVCSSASSRRTIKRPSMVPCGPQLLSRAATFFAQMSRTSNSACKRRRVASLAASVGAPSGPSLGRVIVNDARATFGVSGAYTKRGTREPKIPRPATRRTDYSRIPQQR